MPSPNLQPVETTTASISPNPFYPGFVCYGDSGLFQFGSSLYSPVFANLSGPTLYAFQVMSSTDGITWAEIDAAHRPTGLPGGATGVTGGAEAAYLTVNGVATPTLFCGLSNPATGKLRFISFNFTTGLWGAFTADSTLTPVVNTQIVQAITQRTNGDIVVVHSAPAFGDPPSSTLRFLVFSGGVWTDFDSGMTGKIKALTLDRASNTISFVTQDAFTVATVGAFKSDNTFVSPLVVSTAQVGSATFTNTLVFGGRVFFCVSTGAGISINITDIKVVATDSAANPAALSYYNVDPAFGTSPGIGVLADLPVIYLASGGGLGCIWDAVKPDNINALFVTAVSMDGVTWPAAPTLYWNTPNTDIWNTPGGFGTMELVGAQDFGLGQVALYAQRFEVNRPVWAAVVPNPVAAATTPNLIGGGMGCVPQCVTIQEPKAVTSASDVERFARVLARGAMILSRRRR